MRVLVCGGREYADREKLAAVLADLRRTRGITHVIAGGARGADTLAAEWAKAQGLPCTVFMADWEGLGRKAAPIRNQRMLDEGKPDLVIAFLEVAVRPTWDGVRGTPASRLSRLADSA